MTRRRLDRELVRRGIAATGEEAREAIAAGRVTVRGAIADKAARQVLPEEPIELLAPPRPFVSRGGEKLDFALGYFGVEVAGKRCLDIGASTGGFTHCLLERGAARVYAVDVGHGQLHQKLRDDERVAVLENLNARKLSLSHVESKPVDVVVADVAFISLGVVNPALLTAMAADADAVYLVKPQFEAGKEQVGKGGVVRDPEVWRQVLARLLETFSSQGLFMLDVVPSPIRGAAGNVEFLAHLRRDHGAGKLDGRDIEAIVAAAGQ